VRLSIIRFLVLSIAVVVTPRAVSAQRPQRDLITTQEISSSAAKDKDALAAIRALRPQFLAARDGRAALVVYIDGVRQSGTDALAGIRAAELRDVRYFDPSVAQSEFGSTASGGALVVRLQKAKK
jgi:hypothetical protein